MCVCRLSPAKMGGEAWGDLYTCKKVKVTTHDAQRSALSKRPHHTHSKTSQFTIHITPLFSISLNTLTDNPTPTQNTAIDPSHLSLLPLHIHTHTQLLHLLPRQHVPTSLAEHFTAHLQVPAASAAPDARYWRITGYITLRTVHGVSPGSPGTVCAGRSSGARLAHSRLHTYSMYSSLCVSGCWLRRPL
jgi:hypothetical protein